MRGGNTLQIGQLVKPKLILGPLHREVNTALLIYMLSCYRMHPNELNHSKTCSSEDGKHVHSQAVWRESGRGIL